MADILFESRFLLASLHIKAILRGTTIAGRKKALKSIKGGAGLGDAYGATLERIRAQKRRNLRWPLLLGSAIRNGRYRWMSYAMH